MAISSYFDVVAGLFGKDSNEAKEMRQVRSRMHRPEEVPAPRRGKPAKGQTSLRAPSGCYRIPGEAVTRPDSPGLATSGVGMSRARYLG